MKKYYNNHWIFMSLIVAAMFCTFYDIQVWRALKDTLAIISSIL